MTDFDCATPQASLSKRIYRIEATTFTAMNIWVKRKQLRCRRLIGGGNRRLNASYEKLNLLDSTMPIQSTRIFLLLYDCML